MPTAWETLLDDIASGRLKPSPSDDVPRVDDALGWVDLRAGQTAVLVTTKAWTVEQLDEIGALIPALGIIQRYGLATPEFSAVLRRHLRETKAKLLFLGDLDPFDLASFRAIQLGDTSLRASGRRAIRAEYVGIDDEWLRRCARPVRVAGGISSVMIEMNPFERRCWAALREAWPSIRRTIGIEAKRLLDSGRKIEIEGAMNPALYPEAHRRWVRGGFCALLEPVTQSGRERS